MPSRRVPHATRPNAWTRLLEERRATGARLLDLTESNPTRTGLSRLEATDLRSLPEDDLAEYRPDPRGAAAARAAVSEYYAARGLEVPPDRILLTSGTSEGYAHLFRLLCDPGETLLAPQPSYPLFEPLAALEDVRLATYRLAYDGRWHLDAGSLEAAVRAGARGMIVVQPHHPTGTCLSPGESAIVESLCERHAMTLISDEVFGDFPWPGRAGGPGALRSLLSSGRVPTVALSGLSKVCGLPQVKLGWIAVTGPERASREILAGLEWIADLFLSVSVVAQAALPRLLARRQAFQGRVRERLATNLATLSRCLSRHPEVSLLPAEGGWVATLRMPLRLSEEEWSLELLRRDVVVHPGHFYDFAEGAHLIVSLIVEPRDLEEGLARLEVLLSEA